MRKLSWVAVQIPIIALAVLVFSTVSLLVAIKLSQIKVVTEQKAAIMETTDPSMGIKTSIGVFSPKKGISGGATLGTLNSIKASWFYNWGYLPGYTTGSGLNNYDAAVWKKFVPLITIKSSGNMANIMNLICANTAYCNGGYYLLGNEPDIVGQDYVDGYSQDQMAEYSATQIGIAIKAIKARDPLAKPIILGLSSPFATGFVEKFISKWKTVWAGDAQIASLPAVIKGWHLHVYDYYKVCPSDDSWISNFVAFVNTKLQSYFGATVANQEIWVTEMGSLDNFGTLPAQGSVGRSDFLNRMSCLVNTYERSNLVTRYAWFYHGCNSAINSFCPDWLKFFQGNVFSPEGTTGFTLTDLGVRYASFSVTPSVTPLVTPSPKPIGPTATRTPTPTATKTPTPTQTPTVIPGVTITLTPTPNPCSCPSGVPLKSKGNANCDDYIDTIDFQIWILERWGKLTSKLSDFDCSGIVDLSDFQSWIMGRWENSSNFKMQSSK